jgi:hypothetical protein
MRDRFAENFTLSPETRTNLCEKNRKVVYKYEGIWTYKGCVGKL